MSVAMGRQTGLIVIFRDHKDTWSDRSGLEAKTDRFKAGLRLFGLPTLLSAPFLFWKFQLQGTGQILSGLAVFTALLFGLLVLSFNTGLALKKDRDTLENAHDVSQTVSDLRANVTYTAVVGLTLSILLVLMAATTNPVEGPSPCWTPAAVWLFAHLGLNVFMILGRFRTAYNYLTR